MTRILIVEDAPDAAELAIAVMRAVGFETNAASTGAEALEMTRSLRPDVVLLDLGLPDVDGIDLCRELRSFSDAYVVMLTARDDEVDKVLGLKLGADDYVTKPFSPRELQARVEALLRRARTPATGANRRSVGAVEVDLEQHRCEVDGVEVALTRTEFAILDALSERPGHVLSRAALRARVWGEDWYQGDHVVDVHISNLRRKLRRDGVQHIATVRGVGYRMVEVVVP